MTKGKGFGGGSIEDELFNTFKHFTTGSESPNSGRRPPPKMDPNAMINIMLLGTLKQMQSRINQIVGQLEGRTSNMNFDPYEVFGLTSGCTKEDLDRAYRERAKILHPDAGGSNDMMAALNMARDMIYKMKGWH